MRFAQSREGGVRKTDEKSSARRGKVITRVKVQITITLASSESHKSY